MEHQHQYQQPAGEALVSAKPAGHAAASATEPAEPLVTRSVRQQRPLVACGL
jgi:hypothetical protein